MFTCGICGKPSEPREKATTVVTESRERVYPYRKDAHSFIAEGKQEIRDDPGGKGWEISREILAHSSCAKAAGQA